MDLLKTFTAIERLSLYDVLMLKNQLRHGFKSSTPAEAFENFMKIVEISEFKSWVNNSLKDMPLKMDMEAEKFREEGNQLFSKCKNMEALKLYSKSLRYASFNNMDYGKALAHRSEVLFELGKYEDCLKDIALCFNSKYPEELKNTLLMRKLQCLHKLNRSEEFQVLANELYNVFKSNDLFKELTQDKSKLTNYIDKNRKQEKTDAHLKMNDTFAYATNNVNLAYSNNLGRHVTAVNDIGANTILFKEKAFVSAPIFKSAQDLVEDTCYNCLKHIALFNIPCESCTYCIYCSEECKKHSWSLGHRFECPGMILWYELGYGLPAFKFLLKGIMSTFEAAHAIGTEFGSYIDNYPYANSLFDHFAERSDKPQLVITAMMIVVYLKDRTDFFQFLAQRMIRKEQKYLENLVGGQLVKHMAQLLTNGSLVQRHKKKDSVAAAIYPSISMMNHSCQPNINIKYDGDVAIVTAAKNIKEGEQICNNYGVNPSDRKRERKDYLKKTFYFDCKCSKCRN